jgi:hypothetical protein
MTKHQACIELHGFYGSEIFIKMVVFNRWHISALKYSKPVNHPKFSVRERDSDNQPNTDGFRSIWICGYQSAPDYQLLIDSFAHEPLEPCAKIAAEWLKRATNEPLTS